MILIRVKQHSPFFFASTQRFVFFLVLIGIREQEFCVLNHLVDLFRIVTFVHDIEIRLSDSVGLLDELFGVWVYCGPVVERSSDR